MCVCVCVCVCVSTWERTTETGVATNLHVFPKSTPVLTAFHVPCPDDAFLALADYA